MLRLVVVHGMNGRRMERFYVIGSLFMSLLLTIPPYATGQYGYAACFAFPNAQRLISLVFVIDGTLYWATVGTPTMIERED